MNIVPFQPWHLWEIDIQASQAQFMSVMDLDYALILARSGPALTAMSGAKVLGSCGIAMTGYTGAVLWGFVGTDCGKRMLQVHRAVKRFVDAVQVRRIEATVLAGFKPGCRWMDLLGFEREGLMRCYGPDGADYYRYAKVSPWLK